MKALISLFVVLIATSPAAAGEHVVGRGPDAGHSVSGPEMRRTRCHVQYYRIDSGATVYRRIHCPGSDKLDSVGMPTDGCINRAVCDRAARRVKVRNGRIILY